MTALITMSTPNDLVIEPANGLAHDEAIRRTAADEQHDLNDTIIRGATEAYLSWPNEAGVCAISVD